MATKRMFSNQILDSDSFSDMPTDAQMLYIRLNMSADDRGIVSNPRKVMRAYNFSDDCMKILVAKKFILVRTRGEDGCTVVIIKHWKMHNTIKNDRFKESPFVDFLDGVFYDENKAYSLTPGREKTPVLSSKQISGTGMEPEWSQSGTGMEPQKRLDKDRVGLEEESIVQDNNSFSLSLKEKEEEKEIPLSDEHAERVLHFARMVAMFKSRGFDASGAYALATTEGITREEIDAARAAEKADEST